MSDIPSPPVAGWSLREAAAALLPDEWRVATFPDDDNAAAREIIEKPHHAESPWRRVPTIEMTRAMMSALSFPTVTPDPGVDLDLLAEIRAYEARITAQIAAARGLAQSARDRVPALFARRMEAGDYIARGIQAAAPLAPTAIPPPAWAGAVPTLGFERGTAFQGRHGRWRHDPPPDADTVQFGGVWLYGVRVFAASGQAEHQPPPIISSGAPGRPTSMHLIRAEHKRRLGTDTACSAVAHEAAHLEAWLIEKHPAMPKATAKSVENAIRPAHRQDRSGHKIPHKIPPQNTP